MLIRSDVHVKRWGSNERVDDEDDARERLLDAAEVCFERFGLHRATIDDVAKEAKVSRSTVYRYFDGRSDLLVAAYMRETDAVNAKMRALMNRPGPFPDRLLKATLKSIDSIRSGKYLPLMLTPDGALLASRAVTASNAFNEMFRDTMRPYVEQAQADGEIRADIELEDLIEWMLRIAFSFAMIDSPRNASKDRVVKLLNTFLLPALRP